MDGRAMQAIKDAVAILVVILILASVRITPAPTPDLVPPVEAAPMSPALAEPALDEPAPEPSLEWCGKDLAETKQRVHIRVGGLPG